MTAPLDPTSRHVAANPDRFLHDITLLCFAFTRLKRERGQQVRFENLGPARYAFTSAATAQDLIRRINTHAASIGRPRPVALICPGAKT